MKKILLSLVLLTSTFISSFGQTQKTPSLSFAADFGIPVGDANIVYAGVIGASIKLELPVTPSSFNVTVTSGFSDFIVKNMYNTYINNGTYVPLELGGKFYFDKTVYFEGDLGASFDVNSNYSGPKAAFIFAPMLGLTLPANNIKSAMDVALRYEGRSETGGTISQIAIRVAYRFGL